MNLTVFSRDYHHFLHWLRKDVGGQVRQELKANCAKVILGETKQLLLLEPLLPIVPTLLQCNLFDNSFVKTFQFNKFHGIVDFKLQNVRFCVVAVCVYLKYDIETVSALSGANSVRFGSIILYDIFSIVVLHL